MRQQNSLVANAIKLLGEIPIESVNETLTAIKTQVHRQYKTNTASELMVLANKQLMRLQKKLQILVEDGDIAVKKVNSILSDLRRKQKHAIEHAIKMPIKNDHLPLLPVIPRLVLSEALQMKILRGRKEGSGLMFCSLVEKIDDIVKIPSGCYWIVDVDDGNVLFHKSPGESIMLIMEKHQLGQTTAEVIALGIHSDALSKHHLYALCSRVGSGIIPKLISSYPGREPILTNTSISMGNTDSGAPSCAYRIF